MPKRKLGKIFSKWWLWMWKIKFLKHGKNSTHKTEQEKIRV